jgi:Holliday junction resolvase RusA-like endonuclease
MKELKQIIIFVDPIAKPRMTRRDVWLNPPRPCVVKYRLFRDMINTWIMANPKEYKLLTDWLLSGPKITFVMKLRESATKEMKDALIGKPVTVSRRNDLDNLEKSFYDCILPNDDSGVWQHWTRKIWGENGCIIIEKI